LRKENGETTLFEEGSDFFGFDLFYFPVVDIVSVPGFVLAVLFVLGFDLWLDC
jgi:hypothetical protein